MPKTDTPKLAATNHPCFKTPGRAKAQRHLSTPQRATVVTPARGRFNFSPVPPLSSSSPLSPERVLAPRRQAEDSSSSDEVEFKSPHAVFAPRQAAPAPSPASRAVSLVRTESSLRLPGYFRVDEPIVVISAWGTALGLVKLVLEPWAQIKPITESQWVEIGNTASEFAARLDQSWPDPEQLTISFNKLVRLIANLAPVGKFQQSVLAPALSQLYFAIKYMPAKLPRDYRSLIYADTCSFAQWIVKTAAAGASSKQ